MIFNKKKVPKFYERSYVRTGIGTDDDNRHNKPYEV